MKKRLRSFFVSFSFSLLLPILSFSQLNMVLQDSVTYTVGVNDVCGWVGADGAEYALVGLSTGVAIVNIDTDTIHEVVFIPGVNNLWRDINTYSHYAYVSSEAQVGIQIIDLQFLPDSVQTYVWKDSLPTGNGPKPILKAHTLWTDEDGFLYLNGSNLNSGGVIMCDLKQDPTRPVFLGYAPAIYAHDCYTRDSIIYSSEIYAGNLSIYDAHDPQNITPVGQVHTPYEFTHNSWLSDNSQYMFTTDERPNSYVTSYDISDPANIKELDRYRQAATDGHGNVVHNVYVWNDWVVVAYYANGTIILDAARPDNLVEVGNFDSFLGQDGGFPGVWGSYPFLPSGKILSSDRNSGLYVFIPNYVRACYLEGTVIDSVSRQPIHDAEITILSDEIIFSEHSKIDGSFKMGKAVPGQYPVKISKAGYFDKIVTYDFVNGQLLEPEIELVPFTIYSVGGKVVYEGSQQGIPDAKVVLMGEHGIFNTSADANGDFLMPSVFEGEYELQAGVWGHTYEQQINLNANTNMTLETVKGYTDDFDLDLGWTVSGDAQTGAWTREMPSAQYINNTFLCGSEGDSPFDSGLFAYSTGNSNSSNVEDSEVSGGTTWLASPPMDLTQAVDAKIAFDYWVCDFPPNQYVSFFSWVTNGVDTFLLDQYINPDIEGLWVSKVYDQLAIPDPLDHVQFLVSARDTTTGNNFYTLKAHIDHFELLDASLGTHDPMDKSGYVTFYPNPLNRDVLRMQQDGQLTGTEMTMQILDLQGRVLRHVRTTVASAGAGWHPNLQEGMYILQWQTDKGEHGLTKLAVIQN